jgi:hypothetical protein
VGNGEQVQEAAHTAWPGPGRWPFRFHGCSCTMQSGSDLFDHSVKGTCGRTRMVTRYASCKIQHFPRRNQYFSKIPGIKGIHKDCIRWHGWVQFSLRSERDPPAIHLAPVTMASSMVGEAPTEVLEDARRMARGDIPLGR